jgi:hypothetical protein
MIDSSHCLKFGGRGAYLQLLSTSSDFGLAHCGVVYATGWQVFRDQKTCCMATFAELPHMHIVHTVCTTEKCYIGWHY